MDISSAEANALLTEAKSEDDLREIVGRLDVSADGKLTILYSGKAAEEVWSTDVINGLLKSGEDIRVLDKTEAFRFLDIYSPDRANHHLFDTLERIYGTSPRDPGTSANQFLFGAMDQDGKRVPNGAWDVVSAKFASATVGEVRTITSYAQPDRVFGATELPRVIANENVTTVEGIDRSRLAALQEHRGDNSVFEVVQARSFENTGKLNVAVNYAGTPLRGEAGELQIDGRAYFVGTPVAAKTPEFTTVTRPLADRMQSPSEFAKSGWTHLETLNSIPPVEPAPSRFQEPRRSVVDRVMDAADNKVTGVLSGKKPIRMGMDGLPNDDVPHDLATQEHLRSYERAAAQMREFKAPALWDRADPHSHMLYGLLDGTGNDVAQDSLHATNVAKLRDEVIALQKSGVRNIGVEYKEGPGTQKNVVENTIDGATGRTSLSRAEQMYKQLIEQAQDIYREDPQAKINFHLEGFSRGASTVPLVARMIHERGIPDLKSAVESVDEHGNTIRAYTRYLQSPGNTPMSVGLYDPVATGYLEDYFDRRLPPSVVSGFQINAAHERRGLFPVDRIIPEGLSQDGRFLSVTVAGAHSNIGNTYLRDGLGNRSLNLMTDYRNTLLGEPLFQRVYETTDPRMNVIHHSTEGNLLFRHWPKIGRDTPAGEIRQLVPDYTYVTPQGQVVHLPDQTPEPADDMAQRLRAKAVSVTETPHVRPVEQSGGEAMLARVTRDSDVVLRPYEPPLQLSTGTKVMLGVTAAGGVLSLVEASDTGHRAAAMLELDNPEAARAVLEKYGAKAIGGWAGGALAGAAVGWETGPGVLGFVIVGAVAGSEVGDRAAQHWNDLKIYRQTDRGVDWTFNGRVWQRDGKADTTLDGNDHTTSMPITASYEKSRELNFMAMNAATVLAMGKVPPPLDPFTLHAEPGDRHSLTPADWKLDAQTGTWQRDVVTQIIEHGQKVTEKVPATSERAAELSEASLQIMQANIVNGPVAIAQRYEAAYVQLGSSGKMPDAVHTALTNQDRLMASDGKVYARQVDGEWVHHNQYVSDDHAQGRLRLELNASRLLLQAGAMQHAQSINSIEPRAPRSPESAQRDEMMYRYRIVGTELQPDWQAAILLATQRTREAHGITGPGPTQLKRTANGQVGADSPIAHLQQGSDGADRIIAITSSEDIRQALEEVRARPRTEALIAPNDPEQRIAALTLEQRDARDQATREANRQGLSQDDTQQAATLATIEVRAKRVGPSSSRETQAESIKEPDAIQQVAEVAPSQPVPPAPLPERDSQERDPQAEQARTQSHSVAPSSQDDTTQKVSASSLEERPQDAPDERAVVNTSPLAEQTSESVDMRQHALKPRSERDAEVLQTVDRSPTTPLSQEGIADASVTKLVTDKSPPVQDIKAQPVNDPSVSRSAHIEQDDGAELATVPAHTVAGRGARSPGGATEDRENDRDDIDRRERPHAELQVAPKDMPLPPVIASEQDDEEERKDRGRRTPETSDASLSRTSEQAMPEADARPFDPRHPEHHEHAIYLNAKEKVADLYGRHGIPLQEDQLERTTAALLSDARANKMTSIEEVQFTVSRQKPNGEMTVAGNLIAWEGDPKQQSQMPWMKFSATDMQAIGQRDPDRDYARFRTETIKEQQSLEEFQKQQEAINQNPTGPVMTMGARSLAMADGPGDSGSDGGGGDGGG